MQEYDARQEMLEAELVPEAKGSTRRFVSNGAAMSVANLLGRGLGYISIVLMARHLSAPDMGAYALLYTASMVVELVANLGLDKLLMREIAAAPVSIGAGYFRAALPIRSAMSILSWSMSWGLLLFFFRKQLPVTGATVGIFLATIFPVVLIRNCEAFLTAKERLVPIAYAQFAERVLLFIASLFLVTDHLSFDGFMRVAPIAALVRLACIASSTKARWPVGTIPTPPRFVTMLREGLELFLTEVLALVYFRSDIFIMAKMRGLADTGVYQIAYKIFDLCLSLFAGFLQAAFPRLARNNTREILRTHLLTGSLLLLVPALAIIALRYPILHTFRKDYSTGSTALVWLMLTVPLVYINSTLANAAIVAGRVRLLGFFALILVITNISLDLLLIPRWSINGAAFVTFFCEALSPLILGPFVLRAIARSRSAA